MDIAHTHVQSLGDSESVWFKLGLLTKETHPMQVLMRLNDRYGGCVPINLKNERIFFLSDAEYFEQVMVKKADRYGKYFDGLRPIFGNSMITIDGALWQSIRMPQQPAFTPKMFTEYLPYLLSSVKDKVGQWERYAESGESLNMLEETWGLAASMICKAMFNREVPFNPEVIFRAVKTYTDVGQHSSIRMKKVNGAAEVSPEEAAADAVLKWLSVPSMVLDAPTHTKGRSATLLSMMQDAANDPERPELTAAQSVD